MTDITITPEIAARVRDMINVGLVAGLDEAIPGTMCVPGTQWLPLLKSGGESNE